jgi:NDP-sugar pyrophosphorylase family protein
VQAILLATGETGKLQPLTEFIPSPMVPIANRPIMSYAVESLARFGIKNIIVNLFNSAARIESYFGDGSRWGVKLDYILQREPWGTAGALSWAKPALHEPFIVMPADSILEVDFQALIETHRGHKNIGTIVLQELELGQDLETQLVENEVAQLAENGSHGLTLCETGAYIFEPDVLGFIPARRNIDITDHLLPSLSSNGHGITKFKTSGYWNALDTFECYLDAQKHFLIQNQDAVPGSIYYTLFSEMYSSRSKQISKGVWVGNNSAIHPSSKLISPVIIGENSNIGPNVELGPNSVIGANVAIDAGATVKESILLDNTYVGRLVNIEGRLVNKHLVIDLSTSQSVEVPDQLIIGQTFQAISDGGLHRLADLFFAGFCFILFLPLILIIGIICYFNSRQFFEWVPALGTLIKPTGQHSPETEFSFNLLRFPVLSQDGNTTWYGQQIKRLDWHRIPELWNVIKGDMSIVGVMPLAPGDKTHLRESWQKSRNDYFPGFTGLWYTQSANPDELDEILVTDAYYAATRNWQGDFMLVWKTGMTWLRKAVAMHN